MREDGRANSTLHIEGGWGRPGREGGGEGSGELKLKLEFTKTALQLGNAPAMLHL